MVNFWILAQLTLLLQLVAHYRLLTQLLKRVALGFFAGGHDQGSFWVLAQLPLRWPNGAASLTW